MDIYTEIYMTLLSHLWFDCLFVTDSCCVDQYRLELVVYSLILFSICKSSCLNLLNAKIIGMWHNSPLYKTNFTFYYIYRSVFFLNYFHYKFKCEYRNLTVYMSSLIWYLMLVGLDQVSIWIREMKIKFRHDIFFLNFWYYNYTISLFTRSTPINPPLFCSNIWPLLFINKWRFYKGNYVLEINFMKTVFEVIIEKQLNTINTVLKDRRTCNLSFMWIFFFFFDYSNR